MPPEHDKMSTSNTSAEKPALSLKKDHPLKARNVSDDNEFSYLRKDYVKMQKSRSTKSTRNPSKSSAAPKPMSQKSQQKPALKKN
ncbi:phosphatidylcholine and lysophosphatidylcholine phospholipase [Puccinia graminis f. sp. tritici]|uniref:Phosphatidylcholine and lysophosphatidylcholine phospholipase n=1 Tax=Puccinia graminis f. sp. tritici TaxID=56615 RepID=A0A5B0RDT8_PUCGR|nr:phosphatidylcholine and lysophosphatidylcholine phospholipase [Puccinia graminis f. sp. tritici]KAA1123981.1 phosphatidylcholine and lysophosphatidylcholine phospholipase [Puccinia graminis f. sp. tritici]